MTILIIASVSCIITILIYITGLIHCFLAAPLIFAACFAALTALCLLPCMICSLFVDLNKPCIKRSGFFRFYANRIIDFITVILRIKVSVSGTELLPHEKFLLVGNHRSQIDPILEMGVFRGYNIGFVSKQELFKAPIVGKIIHKCFCLPLDRGSPRNGRSTIARAAEIIGSQSASIGIYPEGTCRAKPEMLPFKTGAFKIAQKAECPIAVVVIRDSELVSKRAPFRKTTVFVDVIGVIGAKEVSESKTAELSERVRDMMELALSLSESTAGRVSLDKQ